MATMYLGGVDSLSFFGNSTEYGRALSILEAHGFEVKQVNGGRMERDLSVHFVDETAYANFLDKNNLRIYSNNFGE